MTDIGVVTLKEGKARGVKDVVSIRPVWRSLSRADGGRSAQYTNGQKNPRRVKGAPPAGPDQISRSRKKKDSQKANPRSSLLF
jgi:hypothetical protein